MQIFSPHSLSSQALAILLLSNASAHITVFLLSNEEVEVAVDVRKGKYLHENDDDVAKSSYCLYEAASHLYIHYMSLAQHVLLSQLKRSFRVHRHILFRLVGKNLKFCFYNALKTSSDYFHFTEFCRDHFWVRTFHCHLQIKENVSI